MSTYSDYAKSISDIQQYKGDVGAQAAANKGTLIGSTIANLGAQIPKQVQDAISAAAERRKQVQIQQILQESGGDLEKAIPLIMPIDPGIGSKLASDHASVQKSVAEMRKIQSDAQRAQLDLSDRLWGQVHDEDSYARAALVSHALGEQVPDAYDQEWVKGKQRSLMSEKDKYDIDHPKRNTANLTPGMKSVDLDTGETIAEAPYQLTPDQVADNLRADTTAQTTAADRAADNARADADLKIKQGQLDVARQRANQPRAVASGGAGQSTAAGIPPNYALLLGRATLNLPAVRQARLNATAKMAFDQQGEEGLKDVIREAAIETENIDMKNQIQGRMATIVALNEAKETLAAMKKAGVPTGWMTGTAEDLARKFGNTTNPQYVALKNRLQDTLMRYRRSITGAQFGQSEGTEYAGMFASYKNSFPVNEALINSMVQAMETYDNAYWTHKLGPGGGSLVGIGTSKGGATGGGVPKVGDTFQGGKVLKVTPVP